MRTNAVKSKMIINNRKIIGDIGGIGNKSSEQSDLISNDSSFMTGIVKIEPSIANDGPIDLGEILSSNHWLQDKL